MSSLEMHSKDENVKENLSTIQSKHDEAFLYISQGLAYQEQNQYELAKDMYNRGIEKINQALDIRCDRPFCTGPQWDTARKQQQKMRKTLQNTKEQLKVISEMQQNLSPPSYDEACGHYSYPDGQFSSSYYSSSGSENNLKTMASNIVVPTNPGTIPEATEVFLVPGGVQLFFLSANNTVTTLSSSTSLHVYKFKDAKPEASNAPLLPCGWLQVGNWTYPLQPGQTAVLESGYGAFLFPDIEKDDAVAVMFPESVSLETRQRFRNILDTMTVLKDDDVQCFGQETFSDTLSRGIVTGAEYISSGLSKGASLTGEYIHKGAVLLKEKLRPESQPYDVDPKLQKGLKVAKDVTSVAVTVSGYLATKLGELTMALGTKIAPHIKEQGAKLLTSAFHKDPEDAKDTMDGVLKVAGGGFQGFSTVYMGLQNAAIALAMSLSNETVGVVDHKYGPNAGEAVGDAVSAVGNLALTANNVSSLKPKAIVKRTAKDAGKAVLHDYIEKNKQQGERPPQQ